MTPSPPSKVKRNNALYRTNSAIPMGSIYNALVSVTKEGCDPSVIPIMRLLQFNKLDTLYRIFEETCLNLFHDQDGEALYRSGLLKASFYGKSSLVFFILPPKLIINNEYVNYIIEVSSRGAKASLELDGSQCMANSFDFILTFRSAIREIIFTVRKPAEMNRKRR